MMRLRRRKGRKGRRETVVSNSSTVAAERINSLTGFWMILLVT